VSAWYAGPSGPAYQALTYTDQSYQMMY